MKTLNIAKILLAIAIVALIAVPLSATIKTSVNATQPSEKAQLIDNDYVFFIIEDEQTPLAALPSSYTSTNYLPLVISMSAIFVTLFIYSIWCLTIKHNANVLLDKLPIFLRSQLRNSNVFLHPFRTKQAIRDAEYCVTFKYSKFH